MRLARIPARGAVIVAALSAALLGAAAPAFADTTLSPASAGQGQGANLTFTVTNAHPSADLTTVRLRLPEAEPVAEAYPLSVPDWAPRITVRRLDPPVQGLHGGKLSEATDAISWTAAPGRALKPGGSARLMVALGPLPQRDSVTFTIETAYAGGVAGPGPERVDLRLDPQGPAAAPDGGFVIDDTSGSEEPISFAAWAGWLAAAACAAAAIIVTLRARRRATAEPAVGPAAATRSEDAAEPNSHADPATVADPATKPEEAAGEFAGAAPSSRGTGASARVTAWTYRDSP